MASAIRPLYRTISAWTITLASLASSTSGVGRQSTIKSNATNRDKDALISITVKQGTSPTSNTAWYVWMIASDEDGTPIRSDGAGASDAAWTRKSAELLGVLYSGASAATGDVLSGAFLWRDLPPGYGIGVVNSSGVTANGTGSNFVASTTAQAPEAQ